MAHTLTPVETTLARRIVAWLLLIFSLRLWIAIKLPLAFDEAYYWLWSQHLSTGYYDHPPMVALVIRLSTMLFGTSEFGVRFVSVLLAIPASWAVWRSAAILFKNETLAARAALYFNLTLLVSGGTVIITPDAPLLLASAFLLYFLAKLWETEKYGWWFAIGATMGFALVSKYSALFMGFSIVLWLLCMPQMRRWLYTPWPYLAGMLAITLFSPVIFWNWQHDNVSFIKQFGRAVSQEFTPLNALKVLPIQFGLLTPPIFILGSIALWKYLTGKERSRAECILLTVLILPMTVYFFWHAFHANVQGNWFMPIYPAFAIAASWQASLQNSRFIRALRQSAAPVGVGILIISMLHVFYHAFPVQKLDHTSKAVGFGWDKLAPQIEKLRATSGAQAILTSSYSTQSWLSFYLPGHPLVVPINDEVRWENFSPPDPDSLPEPTLYVTNIQHDLVDDFPLAADHLTLLATLPRIAHNKEVEKFRIYLVRQ